MSDLLHSLVSVDGGLRVSPALVAIGVALLTRRVELGLGLGVVLGGLVAARGDLLDAGVRVLRYLGEAIGFTQGPAGWSFTVDHLEISLFSVVVAASVAVMGRSGATQALVARVEGLAASRRGAMLSSWFAGLIVFFDDYANCLVVGNAMGPMCDRYQVSREKLAYIVDSTAAPIASLALVSTWVGYEVGLIADAVNAAGAEASAFSLFVGSVPSRFYSWFTIVFVGAIAFSGRDFGPMWQAEARARASVAPVTPVKLGRAWQAAVPVSLLVVGTLGWLGVDGWRALGEDPRPWQLAMARLDGATGLDRATAVFGAISAVLGAANPYHAMLFGSLLCLGLAVGGGLGTGDLNAREALAACRKGFRTVLGALGVLFLAWALSASMADTGADAWIAELMQGRMPAWLLPAATFALAAAISFATGTSFGTMGILIPIAVPVAFQLAPDPDGGVVLGTVSAVLSGACFGDHASPISDTSVLSAMGSGCDLVEHVRTQLPYAVVTGLLALAFYVPLGMGVSTWVLLPAGSALCVLAVWALGRPVPAQPPLSST